MKQSYKKRNNNIYRIILKVTLVLSISSIVAKDIEIIPLDWVNHYGLESKQGIAMWSQDWESGPLLFDGTFAHFPMRFGQWIQKGRVATKFDSIPDTSIVDSWFNYEQGDFLQDELTVGLKTIGEGRVINFNAYKQSFGGQANQYALMDGSNAPIQQSYGIQYQSEQNDQQIWAGLGHFITNNGIPDTSSTGEITSRIVSSGVKYMKMGERTSVELSLNQFQNKRNVNHSQSDFDGDHFLNRSQLKGQMTRNSKWGIQYYIGISQDSRSFMDSSTTIQEWLTIYDGISYKGFHLKTGVIQSPYDESKTIYNATYEQQMGPVYIRGNLSKEFQPRHITFWPYPSNMLETWKKKSINIHYSHNQGFLSLQVGNNASDRSVRQNYINETPYMPSSDDPFPILGFNYYEIRTDINLWKDWKIQGSLTGVDTVNILTDGVGQKVYGAISGRRWLFSNTMDFNFTISANGWLNRSNELQFDYVSSEMKQNISTESLSNIWILNVDIEAIVSTFTIRYSMKNLLAAFNPGNSSYQYSFDENYPALGRQMTVGFEWHFHD
ncbi:MAG: hypothetical protein ISR83_07390 [Candidatus Marinimicrobia bacterium]|nr:hypothetical protein [Candidatus Neomarinimicrobiota bacterium]